MIITHLVFSLSLFISVVLLVVQISTRPGLVTVEKITKELPRSNWDDNTSYQTSKPRQWLRESSTTRGLQTTRAKNKQVNDDVDDQSNLKEEEEKANTKREVREFEMTIKSSNVEIITTTKKQQNDISLYLTRQIIPLLSTTTTKTTSMKTVSVNERTEDVTRNIIENRKGQICCQKLNLTSTGETKELYPFVIGVYHLTNNSRIIYAKEGQKRFISRPPGLTRRGMNTFSWGLNSNPAGKWGWIKAFSNAECPDMIDHWKAYDKIRKTWVADATLTFQCV